MADEDNQETEFEELEIDDDFQDFSIDEDIEKRFNTLQTFTEQGKIQYQAYTQARIQRLQWLDQD